MSFLLKRQGGYNIRWPRSAYSTRGLDFGGVVKPDVMVAKENVRNNVNVCKPETPDVKETKQDIQNRIQHYYTQHPDAGYAEAGKVLGISRQVVRTNVLKMSQLAVGEV